ncbi:alpha-amylase family glycosyl hydrolase [Mycoplasma elephantis]|uniref:alpha-amylase family glycosyl hydrolase n=1 Tax=Mycoplasma elephantis TaxID=114882 RepID=UPI0004856E37|nr:alpha-amylase family glycosyl hydrolase [Mycoplasma elephantis]
MNTIKLEDKVIYQIFPRSFYDSNNDGDGDLLGIVDKLDYLQNLGINAIWLCPIYETNFVDAGYDVLDYKSVWKQFGTIEDFKKLTNEARKRNIDIIMDIVLNHVSNEHEWFKKACESEKNTEHNYFIWRQELDENEKQATSIFGGSAWEFVPSVNKYYFHLFAKEQVDLNWNHEDTIKAMCDVIDFWYNLGVRGFRLDAIKHVSKNFKETVKNPCFAWCEGADKMLLKFNKLAFSNKPDAYTLGEASGINLEELLKYGTGNKKLANNYYNFAWWWIGWGKQTGRNGYDSNWDYKEFVYQQEPFQHSKKVLPSMITNFLSNHDTSRSISRWGDENIFHKESAKTHALMLFVLKGIPCIYYGEEIGLLNNQFNNRNEFRDCDIHNGFKELVDDKKVYSEDEFIKYCNINSRDSGRALMTWDNTINFGFNKGAKTWIKVNSRNHEINVVNNLKNENSIFNFYKQLISYRKDKYHDVLIYGDSKISLQETGVIEIERKYKNQKLVAYLNVTKNEKKVNIKKGTQIISSYIDNKNAENILRPYESILIKL